jgi:hypothetical protein
MGLWKEMGFGKIAKAKNMLALGSTTKRMAMESI